MRFLEKISSTTLSLFKGLSTKNFIIGNMSKHVAVFESHILKKGRKYTKLRVVF